MLSCSLSDVLAVVCSQGLSECPHTVMLLLCGSHCPISSSHTLKDGISLWSWELTGSHLQPWHGGGGERWSLPTASCTHRALRWHRRPPETCGLHMCHRAGHFLTQLVSRVTCVNIL